MAKCKAKKENGQRCGANASPSGFCFWHDKDAQAEMEAASAKGGRGRKWNPVLEESEVEDMGFESAQKITSFCSSVARWVLSGRIDSKMANAAILAASTALRSLDQGDLEQRLKALEEQLGLSKNPLKVV